MGYTETKDRLLAELAEAAALPAGKRADQMMRRIEIATLVEIRAEMDSLSYAVRRMADAYERMATHYERNRKADVGQAHGPGGGHGR